jgi:hypothetical protein
MGFCPLKQDHPECLAAAKVDSQQAQTAVPVPNVTNPLMDSGAACMHLNLFPEAVDSIYKSSDLLVAGALPRFSPAK